MPYIVKQCLMANNARLSGLVYLDKTAIIFAKQNAVLSKCATASGFKPLLAAIA